MKKSQQIFAGFVVLMFVLPTIGQIVQPSKGGGSEVVEWSSAFSVSVCGSDVSLPDIVAYPLLIGNGSIIVRGNINVNNPPILKDVFSLLNLTFNRNQLGSYKNGNSCSASSGSVKLYINGQLSSDFENHKLADGEYIDVVFQ